MTGILKRVKQPTNTKRLDLEIIDRIISYNYYDQDKKKGDVFFIGGYVIAPYYLSIVQNRRDEVDRYRQDIYQDNDGSGIGFDRLPFDFNIASSYRIRFCICGAYKCINVKLLAINGEITS